VKREMQEKLQQEAQGILDSECCGFIVKGLVQRAGEHLNCLAEDVSGRRATIIIRDGHILLFEFVG